MTILNDVKKTVVGVSETGFDDELLVHINAAIGILTEHKVVELDGIIVDANTEWPMFDDDKSRLLYYCKMFIYKKVKMGFDPYPNATLHEALEASIKEWLGRVGTEMLMIESAV